MPKKQKQTAIRWSEDEYNKIVKRAGSQDMTFSRYVRYMVDVGERCSCHTPPETGKGEDW